MFLLLYFMYLQPLYRVPQSWAIGNCICISQRQPK